MTFSIKTDSYKGPLALVLDLIEGRKLLINDLALANITEDFIEHVRGQATFPVEETADFIQIAAMLLLIKSKSLIPDLTLTSEESADVEDLKRRLAAYEKVREASRELSRIYGRAVMVRAGERPHNAFFAPSNDLTQEVLAETLALALARSLAAREALEELPTATVRPLVTIEEMMERLAKRVESTMHITFNEFAGDVEERTEVIVSFLALLELVKQGAVAAEQYHLHGDIRISHSVSSAVPRYA